MPRIASSTANLKEKNLRQKEAMFFPLRVALMLKKQNISR